MNLLPVCTGLGMFPKSSRKTLLPGCPSGYLLAGKHKDLPMDITETLVFSSCAQMCMEFQIRKLLILHSCFSQFLS